MNKEDLEIVIVSGDKDMFQLANNRVRFFDPKKDTILDEADVKINLGIDPKFIPDYIGLAGDKTDNIPGVMGIGDVSARELITAHGYLENILSHAEEIKSKSLKEKIVQQKDQALLSKELALLDCHVPIKFDLKTLKVAPFDERRLFELFKKLEFRKLADEISLEFSFEEKVEVVKLGAPQELKELADQIKENKQFSFFSEINVPGEEIFDTDFMLSIDGKKIYRVSVKGLSHLKGVFEDDADIHKICHNIKEMKKFLAEKTIAVEGKVFDVMLAGYLLSPSLGDYGLSSLCWNLLKISISPKTDLAQKATYLFRLYPLLNKELKAKELLKLFEEIEIPLSDVLFKMEREGVCIDAKFLEEMSQECQKKIDDLMGRLYKLAGMEFNLNSPKQLSYVLFEKLKLGVVKKTKTGFSTDEGVLSKLASQHELPALILEYRQLAKLKSTYLDALPKLEDPKTHRVHASFNQTGTETGRLSSNNPNLQNIPIRTDLGRQIRKAFIPSAEKNFMISADYSQIELRILAHLSKDETLMKAFQSDQDIHNYTAALIFDIQEGQVTPQMRTMAKRVNFGLIYGMSAFGLSKDLNISQDEAQDFMDKYFLRYPKVKEFMDQEIKKAEENGFVLTILNRRRYLPEIKSSNMAIRQFAQRQAINTPVQGSAADLIKLAMIRVQEEIEKKNLKSRMIITVHDELVFDVVPDEKDSMLRLIRDHMENTLKLSVPIKVTMKVGKNWLETKEA